MKEYILFGLLAYLCFCLSEVLAELYDRFVRKKKICRLEIDVDDYMELKKIVKADGSGLTVDKWLQFHFKEDVKEYLENR